MSCKTCILLRVYKATSANMMGYLWTIRSKVFFCLKSFFLVFTLLFETDKKADDHPRGLILLKVFKNLLSDYQGRLSKSYFNVLKEGGEKDVFSCTFICLVNSAIGFSCISLLSYSIEDLFTNCSVELLPLYGNINEGDWSGKS